MFVTITVFKIKSENAWIKTNAPGYSKQIAGVKILYGSHIQRPDYDYHPIFKVADFEYASAKLK